MSFFVSENDDWDTMKFESRAREMAKEYYVKVLGGTVDAK